MRYRWVVCFIGALIFLILGIYIPPLIFLATGSSRYGRENLDNEMLPIFGDVMISQALKEVTLVSYEFITNTPRVYSKWAAEKNPNLGNISMFDAAGATSAAPYYFDPKIWRTTETDELEYLIDGGVIANNPSMWAIQTAELDGNTLPIRLVSLGTGAYETT